MPYINASKRYDSPPPAGVTQQLANQTKTMRRYEGTFNHTAPVKHKRPAEEPLESTRHKHTLPPRPPPTAPPRYGFQRGGGFGGSIGRSAFGYGGQYGYQQHHQRPAYSSWPAQETQWQAQPWQNASYGHAVQPYQGHYVQHSQFWQQPSQDIHAATSAQQAWQQAQQYAYLRSLMYPQDAQQAQSSNQHQLTQQWQIANNAGLNSTASLNATAPLFNPQLPAVKPGPQARVPNTRYYKALSPDGGVSLPEPLPSAGFNYMNTTPWYGTAAQNIGQRIGPAANTRSQTSSKSPEAEGKNPRLYMIPRPKPTSEYIKQAEGVPTTLASPRPLFVILDLNGTLLHRKARGGSNFKARPFVNEFLHYLLQNHSVMVWSSARPQNVEGMCSRLFTRAEIDKLVAVWSRDNLRLPKHAYKEKVQVYKQLSWVWNDQAVQVKNANPPDDMGALAKWSQADTVLIDDSIEKAASEPHNLIELEEFEGRIEQMEVDVLGQVVNYLEALRWQKDVNAYIRSNPFVFDEYMSFDWSPFIREDGS